MGTLRRAGSWFITRRATGELIGEFFSHKNVERFNPATCLIETAGEYLGRINREIAAGSTAYNSKPNHTLKES